MWNVLRSLVDGGYFVLLLSGFWTDLRFNFDAIDSDLETLTSLTRGSQASMFYGFSIMIGCSRSDVFGLFVAREL